MKKQIKAPTARTRALDLIIKVSVGSSFSPKWKSSRRALDEENIADLHFKCTRSYAWEPTYRIEVMNAGKLHYQSNNNRPRELKV